MYLLKSLLLLCLGVGCSFLSSFVVRKDRFVDSLSFSLDFCTVKPDEVLAG